MKTRDQQLARFAESGMGRVMVNAGRSRSCGFEASVRTSLLAERLLLSAAYGYTNAVFTNYNLGSQHGETVDYTDNRVPFVPEHTFSVTADFRQPLQHAVFKAVSVGADVRGAGNVMWNEANTFSQHALRQPGSACGIGTGRQSFHRSQGRNRRLRVMPPSVSTACTIALRNTTSRATSASTCVGSSKVLKYSYSYPPKGSF